MNLAEIAAKGCPDSAGIMELAHKQTGLDDFGDPRLQEPLDVLMESFRRDAWPKMPQASREMAVTFVTDHLVNRQRVIADRKRYPQIPKVAIKRPFIIVGPPRTGSTLLHTLLSMDPENIAPPLWVCDEPSPPPAMGEPTPERLETANGKLHGMMGLIPDIYVAHSYIIEEGASSVAECGGGILVHAMTSALFNFYYPLETYQEYLYGADHRAALNYHHDFLQHVQWGREDKRWALKGADHMIWLRALLDQYPDANLLWTHRDLSQFLSSIASIMCMGRGVAGPVPAEDRPGIAQEAVEIERRKFELAMKAREEVGEDRFCDVSYHDVMANPVAAVERIYERFGQELSPQAAANIREWVEQNPQTKHGVHKHAPDDFGLDGDVINRQFAAYRERFGFGFGIRPPLSV